MLDAYRTVRYTAPMNAIPKIKPLEEEAPNQREQEVLSAVLDLMVEEGDGFSMATVARRASCSKETLYKWYGDRDGLLTATVQWQASKVILPELDLENPNPTDFIRTLEAFAESWLTVITGDVSVALNRLAVSHAGNGKSSLGNIVLENGPVAMRERLQPIFKAGDEAGLIISKPEIALRTFFGLVIADTQIRALLGDKSRPTKQDIKNFAKNAVKEFVTIFGKETLKSYA